ncbi:AcrZ family multidrug efflux pump-associated protein [Ewingella sp. S1.OA.A_B6]
MLEILESLVFVVIMVPLFIALILGMIWGIGSVCNVISNVGHSKEKREQPQQH